MDTHQLTDFPEEDDYWMIVWISQVTLTGNDYRFTVYLASIDWVDFELNPYRSSNYTRKWRRIQLGSGFFFLAEIGSIWQQQRQVFSPAASQLGGTVHTINITDAQQVGSKPLSSLIQLTDNLYGFHPFGRMNTAALNPSLCRFAAADNLVFDGHRKIAFVVIPPAEIIRFYHCGSDYLLNQLLDGGVPYDHVYLREATRYNPDTKELFIRIRKNLPDSDAPYAGRIAGDEVAYRSVIDFGRRIRQDLINRRTAHLDVSFPFAGPTTLKVVGKSIKTNDSSNPWAFFVYSIISCSATYPFEKLSFYRENDSDQTPFAATEKEVDRGVLNVPSVPPDGAQISSTTPPSPGFVAGEIAFSLANANAKFTSLPPVERIRKEQQLIATKYRQPRWYSELDTYTVSDEAPVDDGGAAVGPLTPKVETDGKETGEGVDFAHFPEVVAELRAAAVTCDYLDYWDHWSASPTYKDFAYPRSNHLHNPKAGPWTLFYTGSAARRNQQRRKVVVVQLTYAATTYYLLECEARPSENFSRMLVRPISSAYNRAYLLNHLLRQLAEVQGKWSKIDLSSLSTSIAKQAIHHGEHDTAHDVAARVIGYMRKMGS